MKRIVTGHDGEGKSVFVSVGEPLRSVEPIVGGAKLVELWAGDDVTSLPDDTVDPELAMVSFVPKPGGTRFRIFVIPPEDKEQPDPTPEEVDGQARGSQSSYPWGNPCGASSR